MIHNLILSIHAIFLLYVKTNCLNDGLYHNKAFLICRTSILKMHGWWDALEQITGNAHQKHMPAWLW